MVCGNTNARTTLVELWIAIYPLARTRIAKRHHRSKSTLWSKKKASRGAKKNSKSLLIVAFDVGCENVRAREIA
jgi:hypothetical protein